MAIPGPKTKRLFDAALGRVLLIDEAYKLADGVFGKEAIVEMINCLSQSRYQNNLVVILAGYEHDINKLMHVNEGLSSPLRGGHQVQAAQHSRMRHLALQLSQNERAHHRRRWVVTRIYPSVGQRGISAID